MKLSGPLYFFSVMGRALLNTVGGIALMWALYRGLLLLTGAP